jgi:DNA-directed RNA polymerase subunit E"
VASRKSLFKACKNCGALVPKDAKVCPVCQGTEFTEMWEGILIILDPQNSYVASLTGKDKPGMYAIRVAGKR